MSHSASTPIANVLRYLARCVLIYKNASDASIVDTIQCCYMQELNLRISKFEENLMLCRCSPGIRHDSLAVHLALES